MMIKSAKELKVYQKGYELTISKLTDCDGENSETDTSLDFAKDCGYITPEQHTELVGLCEEIGKMLGSMIANPNPFLIKSDF